MTSRRIAELAALLVLTFACHRVDQQSEHKQRQQQTPVTSTSIEWETSTPPPDPICADSDALQYAALVKIEDYAGVALDANDAEFGNVMQRSVDEQRSKVACFRDWTRTLKDGCVKESYLEWARYYDRCINECEHELITHAQRDATAQRERADTTGNTPLARGHLLAERLPSLPAPCPIVRRKVLKEAAGE